MFTTRLISGIVLVIIAAFLLVEGSAVLYFGSMAISLIGLYELYRVMKIERSAPGFVGYAAVVAYYWIMGNREPQFSRTLWCTIPRYHFPHDLNDDLRGDVPEVRDGADHGGVLWNLLCGDHVLLPLSGAGDAGRKISRMADPFKLLGL